MKNNLLILSTLVASAGFLPQSQAAAILGTADSFAVLGAGGVTSTGPTILIGDLGAFPTLSITGFPPGIVVNGTIHAGDAVADLARTHAAAAWVALGLEAPTANLTGQVLGSGGTVLTLFPGVYRFDSTAQLTGALILDALGDPNARFDFQIGTALTTASASAVTLINGADGDNVFWQVGSAATLGTTTFFVGTIIANTEAITLNTGASIVCGRALALTAAVTLDSNLIDACPITFVPEAGSFWAVTFCGSVFGAWQWMAVRRRKAGRS